MAQRWKTAPLEKAMDLVVFVVTIGGITRKFEYVSGPSNFTSLSREEDSRTTSVHQHSVAPKSARHLRLDLLVRPTRLNSVTVGARWKCWSIWYPAGSREIILANNRYELKPSILLCPIFAPGSPISVFRLWCVPSGYRLKTKHPSQ